MNGNHSLRIHQQERRESSDAFFNSELNRKVALFSAYLHAVLVLTLGGIIYYGSIPCEHFLP